MARTTGRKKRTRTTGRNQDEFLVVGDPHAGLGTTAALSAGAFRELSVTSAIPYSWEDRARKAVEYRGLCLARAALDWNSRIPPPVRAQGAHP